jgi:NADPH:quinone reductase-like Zn-dependent oxidoreductase/uncharacterized protein YndB with AHSA1/START domain
MSKIKSKSRRQASEQTLVITRTFDAPRSLVFQAWTEPEHVRRWWGPKDFTTPVCRIDLRPGGVYFNCMRSPEGQDFYSQGVYREVVEPERIVCTDTFADENGNPVGPEHYGMSPEWPAEALITVIFTEHVGKTRLTLQHSPLPPGRERDLCRQGWEESLDKLADYLAQASRTPAEGAVKQALPATMRAVAIDRFGGLETLTVKTLPVPEVGPDEVLIQVEAAGVGQWDPFEREGGFAQMLDLEPEFPYVLGSDGAGTVVAVGQRVRGFREGDRVYGLNLASPKGGFYAEYAAVEADHVSLIPAHLTTEQAGAMPWDAVTALRGLDNILGLQPGESLLIFGASGGVGHLAVQLAKRMGARVLAVASGDDGVALVRRLGADAVVDGHKEDVAAAARAFAPAGLDAALLTAGGEAVEKALTALREGGRIAYPNGVEPEPQARSGVTVQGYDGSPDSQTTAKLNRLIESGPFEVHIAGAFPLERAADAHRALEGHYLGKFILRPT